MIYDRYFVCQRGFHGDIFNDHRIDFITYHNHRSETIPKIESRVYGPLTFYYERSGVGSIHCLWRNYNICHLQRDEYVNYGKPFL